MPETPLLRQHWHVVHLARMGVGVALVLKLRRHAMLVRPRRRPHCRGLLVLRQRRQRLLREAAGHPSMGWRRRGQWLLRWWRQRGGMTVVRIETPSLPVHRQPGVQTLFRNLLLLPPRDEFRLSPKRKSSGDS